MEETDFLATIVIEFLSHARELILMLLLLVLLIALLCLNIMTTVFLVKYLNDFGNKYLDETSIAIKKNIDINSDIDSIIASNNDIDNDRNIDIDWDSMDWERKKDEH